MLDKAHELVIKQVSVHDLILALLGPDVATTKIHLHWIVTPGMRLHWYLDTRGALAQLTVADLPLPTSAAQRLARRLGFGRTRAALQGASWSVRGPARALAGGAVAKDALGGGLSGSRWALGPLALVSLPARPAPAKPWWRRLLRRRG